MRKFLIIMSLLPLYAMANKITGITADGDTKVFSLDDVVDIMVDDEPSLSVHSRNGAVDGGFETIMFSEVPEITVKSLSYETFGGTSQTSGTAIWTDITGKAKSLEPNQLMYVDYDTKTAGVTLPANVIGKDANGQWYADDIVLTDGAAYANPNDVKAKKITYTRSFSETVVGNKAWQALFVPFAIDVTKYSDGFDVAEIFTICPTKDTNGDDQLDDSDDKFMVLSPIKSGKTIPNVPYLIRPKKSGSHVIVAENATLESSDKSDYLDFSTTRIEYSVTGIYNDMELKPGDSNYYMGTSGISYRQGSPATLKPNRWYMHAESRGYGHGGHAVESETRALNFNILVLGEDIDEAPSFDDANGNAATEKMIFTVNGVRLNSLDNAPAGIYIVNGKKVIKTNK